MAVRSDEEMSEFDQAAAQNESAILAMPVLRSMISRHDCYVIGVQMAKWQFEQLASKQTTESETAARYRKVLNDIGLILDDQIAPIECDASVYTLNDDEFGAVMYCRDLAQAALNEPRGPAEGDET